MYKIFRNIFSNDNIETKGDILHFRFIEAVMAYQVLFFTWYWALYIPQFNKVISAAGIGTFVDVSFLFFKPLSLAFAVFITVFLIIGYLRKARFAYVLVLLGLLFLYAARFSQGKIGHGSNYTGTILLIFVLTTLFFKNNTERRKITFGLILFFIGLGYVSAGFSKLIGTGLNWPNEAHLYLWIQERSIDMISQWGAYKMNVFQSWVFAHPHLVTLLLTGSWAAEFCGFLLWFKRTRGVEAFFLIALHIGIYVMMDIQFFSYIVIVVVISYPWNRLFNKLLQKDSSTLLHKFLESEVARIQ